MRSYIILLAILKTAPEVFTLHCIDAGTSKDCGAEIESCIWKKNADGTKEQMCATKGIKSKKTVCLELKDGAMECWCNTKDCNGKCKPGTCTDIMMTGTTKMMENSTMGTKATMATKPTVPVVEPVVQGRRATEVLMAAIKDLRPDAKKVCMEAVCTAATVNGKSTIAVTNGPPQPTGPNGGSNGPTSDSPVTKAGVHVVIGVFILITPFFT